MSDAALDTLSASFTKLLDHIINQPQHAAKQAEALAQARAEVTTLTGTVESLQARNAELATELKNYELANKALAEKAATPLLDKDAQHAARLIRNALKNFDTYPTRAFDMFAEAATILGVDPDTTGDDS